MPSPYRIHVDHIAARDGGSARSIKEDEMRIRTRRVAILVTSGALALGGLAVAAPALAGHGPFGSPTVTAAQPISGWNNGWNKGNGPGPGAGNGTGARDGSCLSTVPSGTLSEQQQTTLAAMAQEEKLAHDLYATFADKYDAAIFDRIARSETQHQAAVRTLLDRYSLADPTAGKAVGQFSDPAVQATYDRLLAQGSTSLAAALQVGQQVETTDIADLRAALDGLTAADVTQVYTNLLSASQRHLAAFQNWSTR
jgi:hypothetical protein